MNDFFNGINNGVKSGISAVNGFLGNLSSNFNNPTPVRQPQSSQITQPATSTPQVASSTITTPTIPKINIQSTTPIVPTTQPTFGIDTSNITSDHLAGDTTPQSVMNYRNQLQNQYQTYLAQLHPIQQQPANNTHLSPDYVNALNQQLN